MACLGITPQNPLGYGKGHKKKNTRLESYSRQCKEDGIRIPNGIPEKCSTLGRFLPDFIRLKTDVG